MRFLIIAVALTVACAGKDVPSGETPPKDNVSGLLALVVDTDTPIDVITLAAVPNDRASLTLKPMESGKHLEVLSAKGGRYCLQDIGFRGVKYAYNGRRPCFSVKIARVAYPGHMRVHGQAITDASQALLTFEDDDADFQALMSVRHAKVLADYPLSASYEVLTWVDGL